jgi:hypothetical protein
MDITVNRLFNVPDNSQYRATTTGVVSIDGRQTCFSLEPTALMIPTGVYLIKMIYSDRFQRMTPHLLNVPDRTEIEIHGGNYATDSDGCILCGDHRLSDYEIAECKPATDAIEAELNSAEANGETNTITIS